MIKFFRKIRQNLLSKGKTGEYLKYAIGEIVLVVIGILIALSINNWNNYKSDRISETDYLKRLSMDLANDTLNFTWTIEAAINKKESLGNLLKQLKKNQFETTDSMAIIGNISSGRALSIAHPGITNGTFEELINTGNITQLRSTSLRSAINKYYFTREHHYGRIEKKRFDSKYILKIHSFIPGLHYNKNDNMISYRTDLVSFKEIIDNMSKPEFKDIATYEFNLAILIYDVQQIGLDDAKTLLNMIKDELEK